MGCPTHIKSHICAYFMWDSDILFGRIQKNIIINLWINAQQWKEIEFIVQPFFWLTRLIFFFTFYLPSFPFPSAPSSLSLSLSPLNYLTFQRTRNGYNDRFSLVNQGHPWTHISLNLMTDQSLDEHLSQVAVLNIFKAFIWILRNYRPCMLETISIHFSIKSNIVRIKI